MPRLPTDAFERFVAIGPERSYARLAQALGCSKRSVTAKAGKENWQARLAGIQQQARAKADSRLAEGVAAVTARHLRTLQAVQHKALQTLAGAPMGTAAQAAATLIAAVRAERAIVAPPELATGSTWADVVDAVAKSAAARSAEEAAKKAAVPPPPEPVVPPSLVQRVGEN